MVIVVWGEKREGEVAVGSMGENRGEGGKAA